MSDSSSDQVIAEEILGEIFSFQLANYAVLSAFAVVHPEALKTNFDIYKYIISSCRDLNLMLSVTSTINDVAMGLLSILRVYALFGQKRCVLILLCPYIIVVVVYAFLLWFSSSVATSQGTDVELLTPCLLNSGFEFEILNIISPLIQLAFDIIIFILILVRTAGHIKQSRKSGTHSIAEVVLRDDSLYFFIGAAFSIASIFPGTNSNPWFEANNIVDPFFNVHTVQHSGQALANTTTPFSALNFAENRFLGNIGAPLDYNQWDDVDELENEAELEGDGDIGQGIPDRVDPLITLVPVIYDHEKGGPVRLGPVRFVPMQREAGPSRLFS
ncbi:hypothetical protein BDP27DRAFT_1367057 [Rhodocollybia butyracea]|uniref:Uncharacterized protein n=1 Tax=Rhodocollybia butyracea TaxID=206335 RepID=A0A9P5PK21_9AGAR|nr:hypothetical protein BDP27DRAFT_1367057 [Rhodocollybia butyracea]